MSQKAAEEKGGTLVMGINETTLMRVPNDGMTFGSEHLDAISVLRRGLGTLQFH